MTSTPVARMRRYLGDAARAFEHAPAEVAIAVCLAVALSWTIENVDTAFTAWLELAVGGVLILAAAWTGTLLHALGAWDERRRWGVTLAGLAAGALYAAFVADFERASEGWRAALLVGAAVAWLVAVPVLAAGWRRDDDVTLTATDRMRIVTGRILLRMIGAVLYCGALYAGLALALGAVNALFELNLDDSLYAHVFGWVFVVLAPWIVVGGLPSYVERTASSGAVAGVVSRMAAFLVPPLLALYYVILYAYAVRIAVTGEVPKNLVSPLVFAAGALAALGLLLFDPRSREATAFRTLRAAPPLFLPLAALGIWTITLRVSQYGWTEFRLVRLLLLCGLAALAIGGTVQLVRRTRLSLHLVPLGLAALLLLSAVGPWSVLAVSRRSQQSRLDRGLASLSIDASRPLQAPQEPRSVPGVAYDDVVGATRYLARHFGVASLPPVIAAVVRAPEEAWDVGRRLGLDPADRTDAPVPPFGGRLQPGTAIMVEGLTVRRVAAVMQGRGPDDVVATVTLEGDRLRIREAGEQLSADFGPLLTAVRGSSTERDRARRGAPIPQGHARLDVLDESGVRRGALVVLDFFMHHEEGEWRLGSLDGLLVLEREGSAPQR